MTTTPGVVGQPAAKLAQRVTKAQQEEFEARSLHVSLHADRTLANENWPHSRLEVDSMEFETSKQRTIP